MHPTSDNFNRSEAFIIAHRSELKINEVKDATANENIVSLKNSTL